MPARWKRFCVRKSTLRSAPAVGYLKPGFLLVSFLTLFVLLLVASTGWKVYSGFQNKLWDGKTRLTVVVANENPEIYSIEVATGTLTKFFIPKNTQIEAANKYGKWYVGSLWQLGKQKHLKGELLSRSIQKSLGIPVDAWIEEGGGELFQTSALGKFGAWQRAVLTGTLDTNLTFFDRLNLLGVASGDITVKEISLTATRVVVKTKLADGEEAYTVVPEQANVTFEKFLRDDIVFAETKTVSVLNSAGKTGIGGEVTRVAQVLGARVIGARATDEKYSGVCRIRGEKESLETVSAVRIAKIYGCEVEERTPRGPASMEVILGDEFVNEY